VVESLRELAYVLSHLQETVASDAQELTSRLLPEEAVRVRTSFSNGATVVASAGLVENGEELPSDTANVWWSPPRTHIAAEARLGVGFNSSRLTVMRLFLTRP
jgi:hypothetical protein